MAKSAFQQAKNELLTLIKQQKLAGNKLPSEEELAGLLKISRGTIREILRSLHKEGLISKRHGFGNFIHTSALEAKMRIDQLHDFYSLIKDGGYDVAVKVIRNEKLFAGMNRNLAKLLGLKVNEEAYYLECLYFADTLPAIFCQMLIPQKVCLTDPSSQKTVKNIYEFINLSCAQEVEHTLIWFQPVLCDEKLAGLLQVPIGSPILAWEEVYYNFFDEPVCSSKSYFQPEQMRICMLRK